MPQRNLFEPCLDRRCLGPGYIASGRAPFWDESAFGPARTAPIHHLTPGTSLSSPVRMADYGNWYEVRVTEPAEPLEPGDRDSAHEQRIAMWNEAMMLMMDSLYSARGNQFAAQRWAVIATWLGLPASILSAVLAAGAAGAAAGDQKGWTVVLSVIVAVINAVRGFLHPEETLRGYQNKGAAYLALRNDVRLFRNVDLHSDTPLDKLRTQLHTLVARRNALNGQPPMVIPKWAYNGAKKGIEEGQSEYLNDPLWEDPPF